MVSTGDDYCFKAGMMSVKGMYAKKLLMGKPIFLVEMENGVYGYTFFIDGRKVVSKQRVDINLLIKLADTGVLDYLVKEYESIQEQKKSGHKFVGGV